MLQEHNETLTILANQKGARCDELQAWIEELELDGIRGAAVGPLLVGGAVWGGVGWCC